MDKNSKNYYLERIKSKIDRLDLRKKQYEVKIVQQNKFLEKNNYDNQKLKFENSILHDQYNSLITLLEKEGIIFEVNFSKYTPYQWENLLIVKASKGYEIQTKTGSILMMLDEKFLSIIQDIKKRDSYSLIVIRVTDKTSLVQLRFN